MKTGTYKGNICTVLPSDAQIKAGINNNVKPSASQMHQATFYGLAKAAGHDEKNSTLAVGEYTAEAKAAIQNMLDVPSASDVVNDVQVNGASIMTGGVAEIPVIENLPNQNSPTAPGLIRLKYNKGFLLEGDENNKYLTINKASMQQSKAGTTNDAFISCYNQHFSTFYGLAKAAGHDEKDSTLAVGTYSDEAKTAIQDMLDVPSADDVVNDVQINGTSIVTDGVAEIPIATESKVGVCRADPNFGTGIYNQRMMIARAPDDYIKNGANVYRPIVPSTQHSATFYGLAKAAGDTTQAASSNAVGQYTEEAKSAISDMLNGVVSVEGTSPTITALSGVRYVCGEVAMLDFTPCATGICDVVFTSGITPTVVTLPNTVKFPDGSFTAEANKTYEINILDGVYGVVMAWT